MGCRTGFYITLWNKWEASFVASEVTNALGKVLSSDIIPAENEIQCGNYRLHNISLAKAYAKFVLDKGLSDKVFE
jgi:S-ribosylhomocysteine lyase